MSIRVAFARCFALVCLSAIVACHSGPETHSGAMDALSVGMSRVEARAILARDPSRSPPYTFLRNAEGAFEIQGWGDDTVLCITQRALQKRGPEYAGRVKLIDVTESPRNIAGGFEFLLLLYDDENRLLDFVEGNVVNVRSID